jgi:steroid delta-isomerase-like uncharacterized protein
MAETETQTRTRAKIASQAVEPEWVNEFLGRWADAWNSHEPERVLDLMTDDIVYDDSASPETMRGHAGVRPFLDMTWRAFPDLQFEVVGEPLVASGEPRAAAWWKGTATNSGRIDPPGLAPTGKRIEFEGADFHTYRDGKVARLQIVFDMADLMRQLGVLPPPGSAGEKVVTALGNLQTRLRR